MAMHDSGSAGAAKGEGGAIQANFDGILGQWATEAGEAR